MLTDILIVTLSIVLLYFSAEFFVASSSRLAIRMGLTPLIVGLTIVAYGTSAPETAVSIIAAIRGEGNLLVGNLIGANIFNIGIILGVSSIIRPLQVNLQIIRYDVPVMIAGAIVVLLVYFNSGMNRLSGFIILALFIIYTAINIRLAKRLAADSVKNEFDEGIPRPKGKSFQDIIILITTLIILILSANLFMHSSISIAKFWGLSDAVIGLTIIAIGTSLPEFSITAIAAFRGKADIALGNIVGSNIYRILGALGICALIAPIQIGSITLIDVSVLLGISLICSALLFRKFVLLRWEGGILVLMYIAYMYHLWPK